MKKPLNTDGQNAGLRRSVLAYREALRQQKVFWELAQEANRTWKEAQDRCEVLKETLAGYVDKHVDKVVVTLDGGNIACLIQYIETYGVTAGVHVSFLPVFGYEPGPPVEDCEIKLEPLPEREPRYEHAGKLGSWVRSGAEGERYLAVGSQHKPTYKLITGVRRHETDGRSIDVMLEGYDASTAHGCNTNTYVKR